MSLGSHGSNESESCTSRMSRMSRDMRDMRDMQLSDNQFSCHACHTCHVGHIGQIISPQISCHACHRDIVLEFWYKNTKTMSQVHVTYACHICHFCAPSWATYVWTAPIKRYSFKEFWHTFSQCTPVTGRKDTKSLMLKTPLKKSNIECTKGWRKFCFV